MSSAPATQSPATQLPLAISIAPFPEGFDGDMDETFQQAVLLMEAYIEGNFLTGLILPPGSTLPTSDVGPIAMGGTWYFWDPGSQQYLAQTVPVKPAKNYCRNPIYQVQQNGATFALSATGATPTYDMAQARVTIANVLSLASVAGPPASPDTDACSTAAQYTVTTATASLAATDLFAHEHLIEGSDLAALQGETLCLGFSIKAGQTGVYSAYLTSSGRDQSYVVTFQVTAANVWQRVKIQGIPALPTAGTWHFTEGLTGLYIGIVMATGTQWQTATTAAWQGAFVAGTSSNSNMLVTNGNNIAITGIKLEAATGCTPLSVNSFGDDYEAVIRYFFTNFTYQALNAGVPMMIRAPAAGTWQASLLFPRRMCKVPTVTPYGSTSFAKGQITNIAKGGAVDIPVTALLAKQKGIFDTESVAAPTGNPTANGTVTAITFNATSTNGSSVLTAVTAAEAQYLLPGASVSGAGIQAGSTVLGYNAGSNELSISLPATATGANVAFTFSSPIIGSLTSMTGVTIGTGFTGTGVPPNTTVQAILSANSIRASNPIPIGTTTFTFGAPTVQQGDPLLCFFQADARLS